MLNQKKTKTEDIKYIYKNAISSKISYSNFENIVLNSSCDDLPEFYVVKNGEECIGYILLIADTKETIPQPFAFLACHNGDKMSKENHCNLLNFVIQRAKEKNYAKLELLAQNELLSIV